MAQVWEPGRVNSMGTRGYGYGYQLLYPLQTRTCLVGPLGNGNKNITTNEYVVWYEVILHSCKPHRKITEITEPQ